MEIVKRKRTHSTAVNKTNNKRFAGPPLGFFLMSFSCRINHLTQLDCTNAELVVKVGMIEVEGGITTVGAGVELATLRSPFT